MKPIRNTRCSVEQDSQREGGFALVIVLAIIVLLVVLIVGFVASAGSERTAAAGFGSSVAARQLADTAVNLVQGQINQATTLGATVAWASQPGMVRTFSNSSGGSLLKAYKLYSAPDMIADQVSLTADLPPASWVSDVAMWSDLNAPVEANGVKHYPILDPSSLGTASAPEGFSIDGAPGATSYQQAPMPVRWLYVLRNGTLTAPSGGGGKTATIPGATSDNPIVGRIAFWTDDDTAKVNINTASDGTYWDTPRVKTTYEMTNLAPNQPALREFQRYPGHPAMTSLRSVFPSLTADQIYSIVPRVQAGGSNQGTKTADAAQAVLLDTDRLYTNTEELLLNPSHNGVNNGLTAQLVEQGKFFLSARSRSPETNLFNLPRIASWPIFRLTSGGDFDISRTTVADRLLAFCSSTGEPGTMTFHPYFFQRENPMSVSNDINIGRNKELYAYLQYLTGRPFPGFGGNFSSKYAADRDQILTEIFDYIRTVNLRDSSLANWDAVPSTAFATSGWVVPTQYAAPGGGQTMGFGRYYTLSELAIAFICNATAEDNPLEADVTVRNLKKSSNDPLKNRVLGGVAMTDQNERIIQAIIAPEFFSPMQGFVGINTYFMHKGAYKLTETPSCVMISGLGALQINGQALFPPGLDNEKAVYGSTQSSNGILPFGGSPSYQHTFMNFGSPARGTIPADSYRWYNSRQYPFIGNPIKINASGGTMSFSGGTLTVRIYGGENPLPDQLIQTLTIELPQGSFPIPSLVTSGTANYGVTAPATQPQNWWAFAADGVRMDAVSPEINMGRWFYMNGSEPVNNFFRSDFDTIRSVIPSHGDYRLVAASPTGGGISTFKKHRDYETSKSTAATFSGDIGITTVLAVNDADGRLVSGANYAIHSKPDFPSNGPTDVHGDFDNGLASLADGAYTNKSDEGDINADGSATAYFGSTAAWSQTKPLGSTLFSPNRQMPSPGMFGSLSTGVQRGRPWETLLFRPQTSHPNHSTTVPDHLLLDLFWMPVVEPYALSDRFSTTGKVNMNSQILPFSYIKRDTGLYAVFKGERMAVIPLSQAGVYKSFKSVSPATFESRVKIDAAETLKQFQTKFTAGQIFKSASEICDIHIVPEGSTVGQMEGAFWTTNALTGDNLREKIYTTLYPRLTTKSNTYTVHFRVQALKKLPVTSTNPANTWTDGKDAVVGEYRGSTSIERFVDANKNIPDYAANPSQIGSASAPTLDTFYRWRVIENRQFAP